MSFSLTDNDSLPRLRTLDTHIIIYEGMKYLHLRDPLEISGNSLLIPQPIVPLLSLLDGTHDCIELKRKMTNLYGLDLTIAQINEFILSLDHALFLENRNYALGRQSALEQYRKSPHRPSIITNQTYPGGEGELRKVIDGFIKNIPVDGKEEVSLTSPIRGLISPHIDFNRGGTVYARLWSHAASLIQSVEQVFILGTDHFSEGYSFSLTKHDYSTPFGCLSTDITLVDEIAGILGNETVFDGELHHRSEHSIELAALWLQYVLGDHKVSFLPLLCGPLDAFENHRGEIDDHPGLNELVSLLSKSAAGKPTLIIAAGDLSHVGPAFGGDPVTPFNLSDVYNSDQKVIEFITRGDYKGFYQHIRKTSDSTNICGTTPIYMLLRILGQTIGTNQAYAACPADTDNTSFVSVCGITFT